MDTGGLNAVRLIERTKRRQALMPGELRALIDGYVRAEIADYQMAAWLMAACLNGLSEQETVALTDALVASGRRLDLRGMGIDAVDKHSTGGIGDKTTLVLVPLVAAAGLTVAKMSGRGLGFTGGTLDKLESIPGMRVDLSVEEFVRQAQQVGLVVAGQTAELAPGDGKLYALRDVTGTVDSIPLIAASVMSKKIAAGASAVILDVKTGGGAFMEQPEQARVLARTMLDIGRAAGLRVGAAISWMDQPLGRAIGNALEVVEAAETLRGGGPADLLELCLRLGSELMLLAGRETDEAAARSRLERARDSGAAFERLKAMVAAQGGDQRVLDDLAKLPNAPVRLPVHSPRAGYVQAIAARELGFAAVRLGAGRARKGDRIDHATGLVLDRKVGDRVAVGGTLATVHARTETDAVGAGAAVKEAFSVGDMPPRDKSLVAEVLR